MVDSKGISEKNRKLLDILNRQFSQPFSIGEVAVVLNLSQEKVRRLLVYWESRGWLSRLRRNLYITVPLGTVNPSEYTEDPWIMAINVFSPCYVGGWSAAEHWNLTDQIFKDIVAFTAYRFRHTKTEVKSTTYVLKYIEKKDIFGVVNVWRRNIKISVSDPSKTIVDILKYPFTGGGIRHVVEVVKEYFESEHRNEKLLLDYLAKAESKTVYKRLGFIIEKLHIDAGCVFDSCANNISKGFSLFEPSVKAKGHIIRKWNLRVNVEIGA